MGEEEASGGQQTTDTYTYDIANRLLSVNGAPYTWDSNGNLLNDGVNGYAYDAANRMTSLTGPYMDATFAYNGLGDRMQQTFNGQTVNYALDLNAGLTQVLGDGTNTYLYGVDRIAQAHGGQEEFFLGDALGSVRQLTDAGGGVVLAKAYEPYGSVAGTIGEGATIYGYTGEIGDETGLTYLRARYYAPGNGRFTARDTWGGDPYEPMSLDPWNYVQSNPLTHVDPSGQRECSRNPWHPDVEYADQVVALAKTNWLNTYTAAGIAVQCWAQIFDFPWSGDTSGRGPAQVSNKQAETPYGDLIVGNGSGLRCYVPVFAGKDEPLCTYCFSKSEREQIQDFEKFYEPEPVHDQREIKWAVTYMRRRIKAVVDRCRGSVCTSTDKFIAAALAQNAGFIPQDMYEVSNPQNPRKYVFSGDERGVRIDWDLYFRDRRDPLDTSTQVRRFAEAVRGLGGKGWEVLPDLTWKYIAHF